MLKVETINFAEIIVMRYCRLAGERKLPALRDDGDLLDRLIGLHEVQPMDLKAFADAQDVDLVKAVVDIDVHYYNGQLKAPFRSRYAL
jgi:hypothetical protein